MGTAVISPYRFHMFALADQLQQREQLDVLLTAMPKKLVPEVDRRFVRGHPTLALARHAWERIFPASELLNRRVLAEFDQWAAKSLRGHATVAGLSATATRALARAAQQGSLVLVDRGSQHILAQKRILDDEYGRLGMRPPKFDPWIVDRELEDYEQADCIVVPSGVARDSFLAQGIPVGKMRVANYGVDLDAFAPAGVGVRRDMSRVLCVAQVSPQKGHHFLLDGYGKVRRRGSTLVLVGALPSDEYRRRLPATGTDVIFNGPVSRTEVAREMAGSGVFVLASIQEGLALVMLQAMACGLPVIASEATGAADVIRNGVEGFVVPTGDVEALATKLNYLLDHPEEAAEMGRRARSRVEEFAGWKRYGDQYVRILREGLAGQERNIP